MTDAGHGSQLERKQEVALAALLQSRTLAEAAQAAGISLATLSRWQQQPEFAASYRALRRDIVTQAGAQLSQACSAAVATLAGIVDEARHAPAARVSAARTILDYAFRAIEMEELSARVAALESRLAKEKDGEA